MRCVRSLHRKVYNIIQRNQKPKISRRTCPVHGLEESVLENYIFHKLICRFNVIQIQMLADFSVETNMVTLKFFMKTESSESPR